MSFKLSLALVIGVITSAPACRLSEFLCGNGRCVPITHYCDAINDCGDSSDEPRFCSRKYSFISVEKKKKKNSNEGRSWQKQSESAGSCKMNDCSVCGPAPHEEISFEAADFGKTCMLCFSIGGVNMSRWPGRVSRSHGLAGLFRLHHMRSSTSQAARFIADVTLTLKYYLLRPFSPRTEPAFYFRFVPHLIEINDASGDSCEQKANRPGEDRRSLEKSQLMNAQWDLHSDGFSISIKLICYVICLNFRSGFDFLWLRPWGMTDINSSIFKSASGFKSVFFWSLTFSNKINSRSKTSINY